MSAALMAAASGVGFGLFQSVNVRALRGSDDPYASTFVQVCCAALALTAAAAIGGHLGEIGDLPAGAVLDFAIAGVLHFLAGWSLLNLSQQRIGAARTSPLLTTVPVFGVAIAAVTLGQLPGLVAMLAIAVMVAGAWVVATRGGQGTSRLADALPGLGCAFLWALSPTFVLHGLESSDGSPLVGLTVGLLFSVALFAPAYVLSRGGLGAVRAVAGAAMPLKLLAGALVAVSTWWRWAALDGEDVGPVLALSLLSVPVVLVLAPIMAGRDREQVTRTLWLGAGLVVGGALILVVV